MSDVFNSVFDFDASQMGVLNEQKSGIESFNPKPDGSKPYVVTVRLIPNVKSPANSIVHKNYYWLDDGQGFNYDVQENCPVSAHYWALMNSKDPMKEKLAKAKLSIQKSYRCFVQIVNDVQNSANNGKILPWRIPVPVYKQIAAWLKPGAEELAAGKTAKELFNPFSAFNIILTVTNKSVNGVQMRDYKAELSDEKLPVMVNGVAVVNTLESQQMFLDYFNEQQPTLDLVEEFGHKVADEALKTRVKAFLIGHCQATNNFWPEIPYTPAVPAGIDTIDNATPAAPAAPVENAAQAQAAQPATPAAPAKPAQVSQDAVDDILKEIQS